MGNSNKEKTNRAIARWFWSIWRDANCITFDHLFEKEQKGDNVLKGFERAIDALFLSDDETSQYMKGILANQFQSLERETLVVTNAKTEEFTRVPLVDHWEQLESIDFEANKKTLLMCLDFLFSPRGKSVLRTILAFCLVSVLEHKALSCDGDLRMSGELFSLMLGQTIRGDYSFITDEIVEMMMSLLVGTIIKVPWISELEKRQPALVAA